MNAFALSMVVARANRNAGSRKHQIRIWTEGKLAARNGSRTGSGDFLCAGIEIDLEKIAAMGFGISADWIDVQNEDDLCHVSHSFVGWPRSLSQSRQRWPPSRGNEARRDRSAPNPRRSKQAPPGAASAARQGSDELRSILKACSPLMRHSPRGLVSAVPSCVKALTKGIRSWTGGGDPAAMAVPIARSAAPHKLNKNGPSNAGISHLFHCRMSSG
jgi:hypothetical protein